MDAFEAKVVAAATGAALSSLLMTPFDVVKTRLQTQKPAKFLLFPRPPRDACRKMSTMIVKQEFWHPPLKEPVKGLWDAGRRVIHTEGIRGLWKGVGTTLCIAAPSSAAYLLSYDYLLHSALPSIIPAHILPLVSGMLARSTITTIASPLELIRTNLQSTPKSNIPHTFQSVVQTITGNVQNHGIRYLWKGVGTTLWRDVPYAATYWTLYETLKADREGAGVAFLCGASSGIIAASITHPIDVLKTRKQTSSKNKRISTFSLFVKIARAEGIKGLFSGVIPRVSKLAPVSGIMIASFEGIGKLLTKPEQLST